MNAELEQALQTEYPTFFRDLYGDPAETCMAFGCQHGDGWADLLGVLCGHIDDHLDKHPELDFKFTTIKQKFGKLTIYCQGADQKIKMLIEAAEDISQGICEGCGTFRSLMDDKTGKAWVSSLCESCEEKALKQRRNRIKGNQVTITDVAQ